MSSYDYNLSDVWREIRSSDPGTELANVLSSAKIMAKTLLPDLDVEIAGMGAPQTDRKYVFASAESLGKKYPVPGDRLDVFLGQVIHETAHCLFSPDKEGTDKLLKSIRGKTLKTADLPMVLQLMSTVEDALINTRLAALSSYKEYVHRADLDSLKSIDLDAVLKPLAQNCTRQTILNALSIVLTLGELPPSVQAAKTEVLNRLKQVVLEFCEGKISRRKCLISCWDEICKYPEPFKFPETGTGASSGTSGTAKDIEVIHEASIPDCLNHFMDKKVELPADLAKDVSAAIVERREDLTDMTALIVGYTAQSILIYTPEEDAFEVERAWGKTQEVEQQLRRIFQDFRLKNTKHFRGLYSGKISTKRLHRAGYGDVRVFERRDRPEEMDLALCLLMDCSNSVKDYRFLIDEIVTSVSNALCKERASFIALGYSEIFGQVFIARLFDQEIGKVHLDANKLFGNTPSYEGLAAAVAQMLRLGGNKERLLIHFTDGKPTSSRNDEIPDLLDSARGKGIQDYHVALSPQLAQFCERYYGQRVLSINKIEDLPDVVEKILRKELGVEEI